MFKGSDERWYYPVTWCTKMDKSHSVFAMTTKTIQNSWKDFYIMSKKQCQKRQEYQFSIQYGEKIYSISEKETFYLLMNELTTSEGCLVSGNVVKSVIEYLVESGLFEEPMEITDMVVSRASKIFLDSRNKVILDYVEFSDVVVEKASPEYKKNLFSEQKMTKVQEDLVAFGLNAIIKTLIEAAIKQLLPVPVEHQN